MRICLDCQAIFSPRDARQYRCDPHEREHRRKTNRRAYERRRRHGLRAGSTASHRRFVREVLKAKGTVCYWCGGRATSADHYPIAKIDGGPDTVTNGVPACQDCNLKRGRGRKPGRIVKIKPSLVIALVGLPGTGKSYQARQLTQDFDLTYQGVDDIGGRGGSKWVRYTNWIASQDGVVLTESNVIPDRFRWLLERIDHAVFKLTAPVELRRDRLLERGENFTARKRMLAPQTIGYPTDQTFRAGPDQGKELHDAVAARLAKGRQ